jgi:serine/threonine protein kinase
MKVGDRVLTYIVERELGEGGMGTVYLGRHTVLNQQVAIKSLSVLLSRDQDLRERFIQEANIQAGLRHPGIVQVLTADMESEQPVLVMEYIDGKSLSEVLEVRGALPVEDALKIMGQVFSAVGYAHQRGIIHRDLKPSNVMVMGNGEAKVTDFGIAKVLGSTKLTRTGTAMGSAHYMSPEQIRRPETVGVRSDIYALGCMFYEVLTGRPPFGDKDASGTESVFEIQTAHTNLVAPAPSTVNKNVPAWLDQLILRLLSKDPGDRPGSCEEILEEFGQTVTAVPARRGDKTVLISPSSLAEKGSVDLPKPARPSRSNANSGSLTRSLLIAVIMIVCGGVFFYLGKQDAVSTTSQNVTQDLSQANDSKSDDIDQQRNFLSDIRELDGDWYSAKWAYGYTLDNGKGYATITNSPNFEVGQEIVRLKPIGNKQFAGQNVYKDGKFHKVIVTLRPDGILFFEGDKNVQWTMERIDKSQLERFKQSLASDINNAPPPASSSNEKNDIKKLNGDWYSKKWAYGYTLSDGKGYATVTNSPNFEVGQEIVRLQSIGGNQFAGQNVYKDGIFYNVKVTLRPDGSLFFEGEKNVTWVMERIGKNELDQIRQRIN